MEDEAHGSIRGSWRVPLRPKQLHAFPKLHLKAD